jgi:N4-gp56 family major capsid protein
MHPSQATDMRQNTSAAQWFDIQKAAMTGGDIGDNPIFWNSLGMYHGVLLHENSRVTNSVSNAGAAVANTKRALFCGAQAATLAFGRSNGENQKFVWLEELRDFGRQIGIGVSAIWGLKKVVFNSVDFGVIVIDTYGVDIDTLGAAATNAE